jgi:hypothetical protein
MRPVTMAEAVARTSEPRTRSRWQCGTICTIVSLADALERCGHRKALWLLREQYRIIVNEALSGVMALVPIDFGMNPVSIK